jgi:hypothetical protein
MSAPILFHAEEGWQIHSTSRCPVNEETQVRPQFKGGHISKHSYPARLLRWTKTGSDFDVSAYLITGEPGE